MPKLLPLTLINDLNGKPLRTGELVDLGDRRKITAMRAAIATASKDKVPDLELDVHEFSEEAQIKLTVGEAITKALTEGLRGDDDLSASRKLDNFMLAMKIKTATDVIVLTNVEFDMIKDRVTRAWPSALVVGQVMLAIKED